MNEFRNNINIFIFCTKKHSQIELKTNLKLECVEDQT